MSAKKLDIRRWLDVAQTRQATHLVVTSETRGQLNSYPLYVYQSENVREIVADFNGGKLFCVDGVYAMSLPIEAQLKEERAMHLD